jgi:mannose/cellobiose epimerase-like protein (N-acyl-D-glucosamine 2-epimerase family)
MYGYDHERGGLYDSGEDNKPASCKDKIWWSQAEMLAALTEVLMQAPNATYETVLKRLLGFVANHMADPSDGVGSTP